MWRTITQPTPQRLHPRILTPRQPQALNGTRKTRVSICLCICSRSPPSSLLATKEERKKKKTYVIPSTSRGHAAHLAATTRRSPRSRHQRRCSHQRWYLRQKQPGHHPACYCHASRSHSRSYSYIYFHSHATSPSSSPP